MASIDILAFAADANAAMCWPSIGVASISSAQNFF
jgi:hypothetical protein